MIETATEHVRWHDGSWQTFQVGQRGAQYDLGFEVMCAMIDENYGPRASRLRNLRIRAYQADVVRAGEVKA